MQRTVDEALRGVFGAAGGLGGDHGVGGGDYWANDSNDTLFAKAEAPSGSDSKVEGNRLVVAQVDGMRLDNAAFCNNEVYASALRETTAEDSACNDNVLRGSSLKRAVVEHSDFVGNQLNGTQVARITLGCSSFRKNALNASQIRDLGLADSKLHSSTLSGVKLRNVMLRGGTRVRRVKFSGMAGDDWVIEASIWSGVRIKGATVSGLVATRANLEDCAFGARAKARRNAAGEAISFTFGTETVSIRDLALEDVALKNCTFAHCTFDGTTIRNIEAEGLHFEGVDFSGRTIESAKELRTLAGGADAA